MAMDWPFDDPARTAVFTSLRIIDGDEWVCRVTHEADDGAWQFHPHGGTPMREAAVVALEEMVALEPRLAELSDLPLGWHAWRESPEAAWQRAVQEG